MDYSKYINSAVQQSQQKLHSQKQGQAGGGSGNYELPAAGPCLARMVAYVEVGQSQVPDKFKGGTKLVDRVRMVFELFGPNRKPGERVTVSETLSTYHKSNFYRKLLNPMRGNDDSVKHPAQLLGRPFKVRVFHKTLSNGRTIATLQDETPERNYHILPPFHEDPLTGKVTELKVPEPTVKLMCFLWNQADRAMWDSIEIKDGYNVFQNEIKKAVNYPGSHIQKFAEQGGTSSAHEEQVPELASVDTVEYGDDPFGAEPYEEPPQVQPNSGARHFVPGRFRRG